MMQQQALERVEPLDRGPVAGEIPGTFPTVDNGWSDMRCAAGELLVLLARHPWAAARIETRLVARLAAIALGRSRLRPTADDPRFRHPAWQDNPLFRQPLQVYLALSEALRDLVASSGLPQTRRRRLAFAAEHLIAALAPSNLCLTHPEFYERLIASRGRSALSGVYHLLSDLRDNHALPKQVDTSAFRLGTNIAATPGAVVFRNEICELIQYSPRTPQVDACALLFVPAQINKYYVIDLMPEHSLVRYALDAGQQVFALSWRNPTAAQRCWGLGDYATAVDQAIDIVWRITGSHPVKLAGACAGGLTATVALARRAAQGRAAQVASLSLFVTLLESPSSLAGVPMVDDAAIDRALARSARRGVLDGAEMARSFAWQQPDTLIWRFVTHNYVLGQTPPASDILYWNNDTTRLPARLHADLLGIYRDQQLREPGRIVLEGEPIDVSRITQDVFVVAGARDPIAPWQACYRSMQMFSGRRRFVLGTGGHAQAVICPPVGDAGQPKRPGFVTCDDYDLPPSDWQRAARYTGDSWWPEWMAWAREHGGPERNAPTIFGNDDFEPIEAAPGRYVRQR